MNDGDKNLSKYTTGKMYMICHFSFYSLSSVLDKTNFVLS